MLMGKSFILLISKCYAEIDVFYVSFLGIKTVFVIPSLPPSLSPYFYVYNIERNISLYASPLTHPVKLKVILLIDDTL